LEWIEKSSAISLFVIVLLSIYFIITIWIFLYRYFFLSNWASKEKVAAESFLVGSKEIHPNSILFNCKNRAKTSTFLEGCMDAATKEATIGLTFLSIIASTAPFLGLFGTVVGILQSFAGFKDGVTLSIVAPAISEALIATAVGILVAIPAYSFHLILKRKAFEIINFLKMQINFSSSQNEQQ
jgi:biopolymer transport protein ExbB/TolQ